MSSCTCAGPGSYILHAHINVMPKDLAAVYLTGERLIKATKIFTSWWTALRSALVAVPGPATFRLTQPLLVPDEEPCRRSSASLATRRAGSSGTVWWGQRRALDELIHYRVWRTDVPILTGTIPGVLGAAHE
jgi:hypothetical protein